VQLQASPLVQIVPFQEGDDNENGEAALLRRFDVDGADAYELLGYEDEDDEEDTAVGMGGDVSSSQSSSSSDDDEEDTHWTAEQKKAFRIRTRVDAAKRTEGNRRAGGRKTQNAMVRAWNVSCSIVVLQQLTHFRNLHGTHWRQAKLTIPLSTSMLFCFTSSFVQSGPSEHAKE
jgi:hypothetical protein